jgi:iron complex outermembrane receptor protein
VQLRLHQLCRGSYTDAAFAALTDLDFKFGLDITLGARYDSIHVQTGSDN